MKRHFFIIMAMLISISTFAQKTEILSQSGNSITVRRTYTAVETYKRTSDNHNWNEIKAPGRIGITVHSDYGFNHSLEFGGSLFYWFGGKANSNFGLNFGYDHGLNCWWMYDQAGNPDNKVFQRYWDVRAGIVIYKYIGLGAIYGQWKQTEYLEVPHDPYNDWGAYANLNLPVTRYFGFFIDGKWTQNQSWSVGGGLMFMIPTKFN